MFGRRWMARWRERLVLDEVRHLLDDGEVVTAWAHVTSARSEHTGVLSVTSTRCVLDWDAQDGMATAVRWDELTHIEMDDSRVSGEWPLLRLEGRGQRMSVRLPLSSGARARTASRLLAKIAEHRPAHLDTSPDLLPGSTPQLPADHRGVRGHLRRVLVTIAGILVILLGAIFASPFVPGPGALTTLFGLAILAREYDWAREVHQWMHRKVRQFTERLRERRRGRRAARPLGAPRDHSGEATDRQAA